MRQQHGDCRKRQYQVLQHTHMDPVALDPIDQGNEPDNEGQRGAKIKIECVAIKHGSLQQPGMHKQCNRQ
jgi:hypothetical protein